MKWHRGRAILGLLGALAMVAGPALAPACAQQKPAPKEDEEVKLGRENAAENDKSVKLVTDAALIDRVSKIGQAIAAVANTEMVPATWGTSNVKKFDYSFKIVDEKDVNAYSLPGGFIYVNKGLLDYVHSDDELAGVLAHEITHAAHHHMMKLLKEQNKMQFAMPLLLLIAILTKGDAQTIQAAGLASQLYMVAKLNGYGVQAEKDADHGAVEYLVKTKYNPVGLLTFMERLAHDESLKPEVPLGIYRTHPPSPERASALIAELGAMRIAINRSETDPALAAQVTDVDVNGAKLAEVRVAKTVVTRLAASGGTPATDRARKVSSALDKLLDSGLQTYEIRLSPDKRRLIARMQTLVEFTDQDAAPQKSTPEKLAADAAEAIKTIIWQLALNRIPATREQ